MLSLIAVASALFLQKDPGRVEVEGLVVTAVARPSRFASLGMMGSDEFEVEFSAEPKSEGARLTCHLEEGVRIFDADGKTVSGASKFGPGMSPTPAGPNRWSVRLKILPPPAKTLHAVEGTVLYAPTQPKTAVFAGATLKPNSTVSIEGGTIKLTVLDFDDGRPDIRLRATVPATGQQPNVLRGAHAILVDANGKETALTSSGGGFAGGSKSVDHRLVFRGKDAIDASSLRMLRVEIRLPSANFKKAKFRLTDVPVQPFDPRRGMEP